MICALTAALACLASDPAKAKQASGTTAAEPVLLPSGGAEFHDAMLRWTAQPSATTGVTETVERLELPLAIPRLSSGFGERRDPLLGSERAHLGIDIPNLQGTPVLAAAGGVVLFAGWAHGYGNLVRVDHGRGNETRYAHLAKIAVRTGNVLRQGEVIGRVGTTGRSTGAHLHFELRQEGIPVDPLPRFNLPLPASATPGARAATDPASIIHWNGYVGSGIGLADGSGGNALPQSWLH